MDELNILWRNMKWRLQNPVTIVMTIIQPLIWLVLYGLIAGQSMPGVKNGNYTAFILPGIMVLVTFSCSGSSGVLDYVMRSKGSFYRILIAPVKRSSIVLGQILEAVLLSFAEVAILLILSIPLLVRIASGFWGVLLILPLIFLTAFFMSTLSYSISLCLPNEDIYFTVMNTIALPIFFVSTALFPMDGISGGMRVAVMLNPFTYVINCLRNIILGTSADWQSLLLVIAGFVCLCCGSFAIATRRLKKEGE